MAHPKKPKPKPNCLAGLAGDPPYPQYGPPDPKPPPTPEEVAERERVNRKYAANHGTVWSKGSGTELRRQGAGSWWFTDSHDEYGTELTREDLRRLRDALDRELGGA